MFNNHAIDFRHGQHRRRSPFLGQRLAKANALRACVLTGEAVGMGHDRRDRRGRPLRPDAVEGVFGDCAQLGPGLLHSSAEALDFIRRMQPRVIAEYGAA